MNKSLKRHHYNKFFHVVLGHWDGFSGKFHIPLDNDDGGGGNGGG
jgi:hypothetical protein